MLDPEILEFRFPVRIEEMSIRLGSGGRGKFKGGDGITSTSTILGANDSYNFVFPPPSSA